MGLIAENFTEHKYGGKLFLLDRGVDLDCNTRDWSFAAISNRVKRFQRGCEVVFVCSGIATILNKDIGKPRTAVNLFSAIKGLIPAKVFLRFFARG